MIKIYCVLAALVVVAPALVLSQEPPCKPLKVEIEGARRTKLRVIKQTAGLDENACAPSSVNTDEIEKKLLEMKLFSSVEATTEVSTDAVVVRIKLKERFTPVPVPIFFATKEDMGGGVFFFDPNFLGLAKVLIAGAVISKRGERYQVMYMDDHVLGSQFALFIRSVYGDNDLKRFSGEDEIYAFNQRFSQLIGAVGYHVTDELMPSFGLLYRRQDTDEADDYPDPPDDLFSPAFVIDLRYKGTRKEEYFDRGLAGSLSFDQALPMLGSQRIFSHVVANVEYASPIIRKVLFRLEGETGFGFGDQDILTYFRLGGETGSRGLPNRGLWVRDYGSASIALEEPLYRHRWGTLTTTQFADLMITGEDDPVRSYPGVGIGLRIYLKEIAVPAVGVDGAYSTWTENFRFSAYIGKTF